jgi:hypothetical protein
MPLLTPINTVPYTGHARSGVGAHSDSDGSANGDLAHADSSGSATDHGHGDSGGTAQGLAAHADSQGSAQGSASHANSGAIASGDYSFACRGGWASGSNAAATGAGATEANDDFECLGGAQLGLGQFHRCVLASVAVAGSGTPPPLTNSNSTRFTPDSRASALLVRIQILADDAHGNLMIIDSQIIASKSGGTWSIVSTTSPTDTVSIGTTTDMGCTFSFDGDTLTFTPATVPGGHNDVTYVAICEVLENLIN